MNPDRLAELEEERRFLLRSLADLEREHEAGDVDRVDYRALKDGYTVRAAAVLRDRGGPRGAAAQAAVVGPSVVAAWVIGRARRGGALRMVGGSLVRATPRR